MSSKKSGLARTIDRDALFPATGMPDRDWWQALWPDPANVLQALGLQARMEVVDLCYGDGYFTGPLRNCQLVSHITRANHCVRHAARSGYGHAHVSRSGAGARRAGGIHPGTRRGASAVSLRCIIPGKGRYGRFGSLTVAWRAWVMGPRESRPSSGRLMANTWRST